MNFIRHMVIYTPSFSCHFPFSLLYLSQDHGRHTRTAQRRTFPPSVPNGGGAEFPDSLRKVSLDGCNGTGGGGRDRTAAVRVLSFCLLHPKVLGFMDFSRWSTKVLSPVSDPCEDEAKIDPCINPYSYIRLPCTPCGSSTTS